MTYKTKRDIAVFTSAIIFNIWVFYGSRLIARDFHHFCFSTSLDNIIPLMPWTILIYFGAFEFWVVNYYLGYKYDESGCYRFITSFFIGEAICFLTFLIIPTTMTRPVISGSTLFENILRLTYLIDTPDNLFPSLHCYSSWLCWIGVRKNKNIPKWYQYTSLLAAIAICISTLTVKQHVIADVFAGIALAEFSYYITRYNKLVPILKTS